MQQVLHRGAALMQHHEEALNASWDDLKLFLACAKFKSFRNAAEELGLTSTTLMRRIDRLEESIGCKLFLRDQSGLTLSDEGTAMIADVAHMERHAFNVFRRASRSSQRYVGHGARRGDGRPRQFLDPAAADRFPEDLPQDHRRPALCDGAGRRRAAGVGHCDPARAADQSRPHRRQARPAAHLSLRLQGLCGPLRRAGDARRIAEPPHHQAERAAGRRRRLCPRCSG